MRGSNYYCCPKTTQIWVLSLQFEYRIFVLVCPFAPNPAAERELCWQSCCCTNAEIWDQRSLSIIWSPEGFDCISKQSLRSETWNCPLSKACWTCPEPVGKSRAWFSSGHETRGVSRWNPGDVVLLITRVGAEVRNAQKHLGHPGRPQGRLPRVGAGETPVQEFQLIPKCSHGIF